ncbi:hypothetical protein JWJ90_20490 [Desulfobulbus rhabdoformis]|uniref:hypothetical protein n=1 Tax=Desulfobulbus rhabdoformis TaxID=34032 RepID=UPI0019626597|nr:hypothetical protein [Desulfobulbus rhabdoformis]MBM9616649.1 hypothetical protein [Desulfobulbus rhabdoformis]
MGSGWIKMHRSVLDWEWYRDRNTCRLFIHLLLTANHKENEWHGIKIQRGQRVFGREKLAGETGLSVQEIRTALSKLKSTRDVTISSTGKYSVLTICNYEKYQYGAPAKQPGFQPDLQPQINHKQEVKKKETTYAQSADENTLFAEFWKAYPKKKSKIDAQKAWEQSKGDSIFNEIMAGLKQAITSPDWTKDGGKYIPYPGTWLRAGGWMDEIGTSTPKSCQTCRLYKDQCQGKEEICSAYKGAI